MGVGGHGADEHAWVAGDMVHAQAVAEDGAAGEGRAGVQREHGYALVGSETFAEQSTHQGALAGARRPGDAYRIALPAVAGEGRVQFTGGRGLALQQGDGASQGCPVATGDTGGEFRRADLRGGRAQSADRRKSTSESALGTGRGLVPHQMSWKM